jgi:predicted enzyme related to lactoylglutathione lyase
MQAPIVFFDIAGPELASQAAFHKSIFGWESDASGAISIPVTSPLMGNLRVEPPTQGPVTERLIYIGVPDINATLETITQTGGGIVFPRMEVPGVAVIALFTDPAGNRMGLVEMDGGKAKVPSAS